MKEPRPFHIGSKVVPVGLCATDDDTPYPVLFCYEGLVYMADPLNGGIDSEKPHNLVHASDGAPLGDWVPIKPDGSRVCPVPLGYHEECDEYEWGNGLLVDTANAIVRMEEEQ